MKAVVAAFNQEKALVGAFSVITNLRTDLRFKLYPPPSSCDDHKSIDNNVTDTHRELSRVDTLLIGYLENSH